MKGLLINAIAAAVERVSVAIEERAAETKARAEMHDFCEKHGYMVTPVMHAEPVSFMEIVNQYTKEGLSISIEYTCYPVTIERDGSRARTNWTATNKTYKTAVITVHSGEVKF